MALRTQSICSRPSAIQAFDDAAVGESGFPGPRCNALRASSVRHIAIVASVVLLFLASGPPAVFGAVVSIVVDPVEREVVRRFAHIDQEVFKLAPSGANTNPATAVEFIIGVCGASTSVSHTFPSPPYLGTGHSMRALRTCALTRKFSVETSATACGPVAYQLGSDVSDSFTIASTPPNDVTADVTDSFDDRQPTKSLSSQVEIFRHVRIGYHRGVVKWQIS